MKLNLTARLYHFLPLVFLRSTARVTSILWRDQGYLRSVAKQRCVDASGSPLPWYTYPAIEFLRQLDFSDKSVFEYGSGYSTLFWGARAREVVAVEHSPEWFDIVKRQVPSNCRVMLEADPAAYVRVIERTENTYDVVVVDGLVPKRARAQCSVLALRHLAPGGMIVLDNSDYLPGSTDLLRRAGLIEIDLNGFGPCNDYAWTTSLFLTRDYAFQPIGGRQPHPPVGGLGYNWEPRLERLLKQRPDLPLPQGDWRRAPAEHLLTLITMDPSPVDGLPTSPTPGHSREHP
jgi:Methyltransferase domain